MNETNRDKFTRIASKRMSNVLKEMKRLQNCSNTRFYEYSEQDVDKMMKALNSAMKSLKASYDQGVNSNKNDFKF